MGKPPKKIAYRDSGTGEFITRKEAEKRPKETEKERISVGKPPKSKK